MVRTTTQALLVLTDRLSALDMVLSCGAFAVGSSGAALCLDMACSLCCGEIDEALDHILMCRCFAEG